MSDSFIAIVPEGASKGQARELADKVIIQLTKKGIIKGELTDCALGDKGYEPGDNFKDAIEGDDYGLAELRTNGLAITTKRQVFHNGGNGIEEISCPKCNTNIIDSDWGEALDEWTNETGKDKITCDKCKSEYSITEYYFEPNWGFGNLGLTFWNWPELKNDFIDELEQLFGQKVKIVHGRL